MMARLYPPSSVLSCLIATSLLQGSFAQAWGTAEYDCQKLSDKIAFCDAPGVQALLAQNPAAAKCQPPAGPSMLGQAAQFYCGQLYGVSDSSCQTVMKTLLEKGADANGAGKNGDAPLHTLMQQCLTCPASTAEAVAKVDEAVMLFMKHEADAFARSATGNTVVTLAENKCAPLTTINYLNGGTVAPAVTDQDSLGEPTYNVTTIAFSVALAGLFVCVICGFLLTPSRIKKRTKKRRDESESESESDDEEISLQQANVKQVAKPQHRRDESESESESDDEEISLQQANVKQVAKPEHRPLIIMAPTWPGTDEDNPNAEVVLKLEKA